MNAQLSPPVLLQLGPFALTETMLVSSLLTAALSLLAVAFGRRVRVEASSLQASAEALLGSMLETLTAIAPGDPWRLVPLASALAVFIGAANLVDVLPRVSAPTGDLSTAAALAAVVFLAAPWYGVRELGWRRYLRNYLRPTPLMLPFNVIGELSRTIALAVRLFGNVMSLGLVVSVLLLVASFLVPVPIMALSILTGLIQAYIFSVLAAVYVGAAMRAPRQEETP